MTNVGEDVKKVNPCALLVERQIDTAHCQNTMEFPLKVKNKMAIWFSNATFDYISKVNEITILKRYLHPHVLSSTIHNSQDTETP